jgi:hypothetical protein
MDYFRGAGNSSPPRRKSRLEMVIWPLPLLERQRLRSNQAIETEAATHEVNRFVYADGVGVGHEVESELAGRLSVQISVVIRFA